MHLQPEFLPAPAICTMDAEESPYMSVPWFPCYTVRRSTFLSCCSSLQGRLQQCSRAQCSAEAPKPSQACLTTSCGCQQHQSPTGKAAGERQLVPRYASGCHDIRAEVPHQLLWPGTDWQQQNSPLPHSSRARLTGPMPSDLSSLRHDPHRALLSSMPSYCNSTRQGKILKPFLFLILVLQLPH